MILSWASLFGFIQARYPRPVERVVFLVDPVALSLRMSVNGDEAKAAPLKFHEVEPVLSGFIPALGVPDGADVQRGSIEIDYVGNAATVNIYYTNNGNPQRVERRFDF